MKVTVVRGTVIYKGKSVARGETFECEKEIAESLLKSNTVAEAVKATKKGK